MIGSDITEALPELRAQAESLMVDTVRVEARTGQKVINPANGKLVEEWATVYTGRGNWLTPGQSRSVDAAGTETEVDSQVLCLPVVASAAVRAGMRVTTTASAFDPARVGRQATIVRDLTQSHPVRRRLACEEA